MLARSACACALLVALCAPLGAQPVGQQPLGDERLVALGDRYFAELWKLDPVRATRTGVHDYDDKLDDCSETGFLERIALARRTRAELQAIDPGSFGAEGSYDAQILAARVDDSLVKLQTRETWRHDPSIYTTLAANGVYSLLSRNYAPLSQRLRAAIARERAIPALLAAGKANVTTVDAVTAEVARDDIAGTIGFFTTALPVAVEASHDAGLLNQFKSANQAAIAALQDYAQAMNAGPFAHPSGTFAVGPEVFERMLALQELAPLPLAAYERIGESALESTRADFIATAKTIDPAKPAEAVAAQLGANHPASDALIRTAEGDIVALRAFVVAHRFVTLPAGDDVKVVATPAFARQTTFASLNAPGPLEKTPGEAYYDVTPVEPDWSAERKEQHLAFFNEYAFPLITAHEVTPGHYLNYALDRTEKLSQIRRLLPSASFSEGWAHYVEQAIVDEGWGNGDPHVRLAELQLALQRECRFLVGLREHTQGMSVEAATRFFEENAYMAEEPAHREALRGTQDPLYGYYTLGKLEILKLRADYRKKYGSHYTLQSFHDDLLAHGDPPLAIARKILLGADDDGRLL